MSNYKTDGVAARYAERQAADKDRSGPDGSPRSRHATDVLAPAGQGRNGWDAYRRWLTRVQAPNTGRTPLDPALYTWKGYRNWSEKVRRDWKSEDQ
jgi:hypothetical protein